MEIPQYTNALIKASGKGLKYVEKVLVPPLGDRDVMIKVWSASICGSDLHIFDDDITFRDRVVDGQLVGHEFSGEVIQIGSQVTTLAIGDKVAAESHVACESCIYCRNDERHNCQEVTALGFDRPGGFAQFTVIPEENAKPVPKDLSYDAAACLEPFGNAVYTARLVDLVNKVVWVTGCGPQGLMAIAVAKAAGARKIIATEIKQERIALAQKMLSAHSNQREKNDNLVLNPVDNPDFMREIYKATKGVGVDVVLEMCGVESAIRDALLALRKGGHFVALGLSSKANLRIDWNNVVLKEAHIHGIYGRLLDKTWEDVEKFLSSGKVTLKPIIFEERFSLQDYNQAFELVQQGKEAKVIFKPNGLDK